MLKKSLILFLYLSFGLTSVKVLGQSLSLPFFDNFDYYRVSYNPDSSLWQPGSGVYVNNHLPYKPTDLGVATFDGLDSMANAYRWDNAQLNNASLNKTGLADNLLSRPIDLSNLDSTDNVALSFFYQAGGIDSILFPGIAQGFLLQLYMLDSTNVWRLTWPAPADSSELESLQTGDDFRPVFIPIKDDRFFHDNFQIRFQNAGRLTSNIDMWGLDYVYLDSNRTDSNIVDLAFSTSPESIFKGYQTLPMSHFLEDPESHIKDQVSSLIRNLSYKDSLFIDPDTIRLTETISGTVLQELKSSNADYGNGILVPNGELQLNFNIDKSAVASKLSALDQESFVIKNKFKFKRTATQQSTENDSIVGTSIIDQYYAYDDGTSEYAAQFGSENGFFQLAYEFDLLKTDTLSAIYFHFLKYTYDYSTSNITLKVWKALKGIDGATEDELLYTIPSAITYVDTLLYGFHKFELSDLLVLNKGKFYIGFDISLAKEFYVATDVSNDTKNKIYQDLNFSGWDQGFLTRGNFYGSLMIRPKFGYKNDLIQAIFTKEVKNEWDISLYPNPTTGIVYLSDRVDHILVTDVIGNPQNATINLNGDQPIVDLSNLSPGIFVFQIKKGNQTLIKKVIKH